MRLEEIQDVTHYDPAALPPAVLRDDFRILLAWEAQRRANPAFRYDRATIKGLLKRLVPVAIEKHAIETFHRSTLDADVRLLFDEVAAELKIPPAMIESETDDSETIRAALGFDALPSEIVLVPAFVSLAGGAVEHPQEAADLDFLVRDDRRDVDLEVLLEKHVLGSTKLPADFIYSRRGPHTDSVPLYDLVLARRSTARVVRAREASDPRQPFSAPHMKIGFLIEKPADLETAWADWAAERAPIDVEQKWNGFRAIAGVSHGAPFVRYDGHGENRARILPELVSDLEAIGGDVVLDVDLDAQWDADALPVARVDLGFLNGGAPVSGAIKLPAGTARLRVHAFDLLFADGRDLTGAPWTARRKALEQLFARFDFATLQLTPAHLVRSKSEFLRVSEKLAYTPFSEGVVMKTLDGRYAMAGDTDQWAKAKKAARLALRVLGRAAAKGGGWNLEVAPADAASFGSTFTTSRADLAAGEVAPISAEEVIPDGARLRAVQMHVADGAAGGAADTAAEVVRKAHAAGVLQTSPESRKQLGLREDLREAAPEAKLDFQPGDHGRGVMQTHERGLSDAQRRDTHDFGWTPLRLDGARIAKLQRYGPGPWGKLNDLTGEFPPELAAALAALRMAAQTSSEARALLVLVEPVSIHTDFRLAPAGKPWWEGWEVFSPGNQFRRNPLRDLKPDDKPRLGIKTPRTDEGSAVGDVVRGPLEWLKQGERSPTVFSPGQAGATSSAWGRMTARDRFAWTAGAQEDHLKEFRFRGDVLNGRYVLAAAPLGGERVWLFSRPADQTFRYAPLNG